MNLAELVQVYKLEEALDDLVIGHKTHEASLINNEGVDGQLQFLIEAGWTENQIRAFLTDEELSLEEEMGLI